MAKIQQQPNRAISDVQNPSFFNEGYEETFNEPAHLQVINSDDGAKKLHREVLQAIRDNRGDIMRLNKVKAATLAYKDRNPALNEIAEQADHTRKKIFERSNKLETKIVGYKMQILNRIESELDAAFANSRQAGDIRLYMLRDLKSTGERLAFAREAVSSGDVETISVILKSKPFLTKLSPEDIDHLRQQYLSARPEAPVIEKLKTYGEHIGRGYRAFEGNLDEVISNSDFKRAKELKEAAERAKNE